jgi:hypothetical protein
LSGCAGTAKKLADADRGDYGDSFEDEPTKDSSSFDDEPTKGSSDDFADEPTKLTGGSDDLLPLCLGVQNSMLMKMCSAAMSGDASQCDDVYHERDIDQQYFQNMCKIWVAAGNKDTAACEGLSVTIGGASMDCEMTVAQAIGDASLCDKLDSENARNGCNYHIKVAKGDMPLSECIDPECVFEYALTHQDKEACKTFADVTSAFLAESEYACGAMIDKEDVAYCRKAPGGLFGFTMCTKKAGIGRAYLGDGDFEPSNCGDDDLCIRDILSRMVIKKASE